MRSAGIPNECAIRRHRAPARPRGAPAPVDRATRRTSGRSPECPRWLRPAAGGTVRELRLVADHGRGERRPQVLPVPPATSASTGAHVPSASPRACCHPEGAELPEELDRPVRQTPVAS